MLLIEFSLGFWVFENITKRKDKQTDSQYSKDRYEYIDKVISPE